jgi:hypothetical protein
MRENIVGGATRVGYKTDIMAIVRWAYIHEPNWLSEQFKHDFVVQTTHVEGYGVRRRGAHFKDWISNKLRHADHAPILLVANVTPGAFMQYLKSLRNTRTGARLSKSAYGNKRSALNHLFRCHGGLEGYPAAFGQELASLFKGFTRVVQQHAKLRLLAISSVIFLVYT